MRGFTLAEVLITLGIIGVVAAMTIPSLIAEHREKATVAKLKKVYSTFANAYLLACEENGTPDAWYNGETPYSAPASDRMFDLFAPYLNVSKVCRQTSGCLANVVYKKTDGSADINWDAHAMSSHFILADGTGVFFYSYSSAPTSYGSGNLSETYGAINVDINGKTGPNKWGVDMFSFLMTKNGIVATGTEPTTTASLVFPSGCARTGLVGRGEACAAWVIFNENMDYLKCDDLSWDGKTKCK